MLRLPPQVPQRESSTASASWEAAWRGGRPAGDRQAQRDSRPCHLEPMSMGKFRADRADGVPWFSPGRHT